MDRTIELANVFGKNSKKLNFTNYFKDNFFDVCKDYLEGINKCGVKFGNDYFKDEEQGGDLFFNTANSNGINFNKDKQVLIQILI